MPDTAVNTNNGNSPTTGDLPAMPETSPPKGRKTRRSARPTAKTGNGEGAATGTAAPGTAAPAPAAPVTAATGTAATGPAATGTAATGGRRGGPRTKKPRTP